MGGVDALQQAIQSRQTGEMGASQQVTPSAATFDPASQGAPNPMQGGTPQGDTQQGAQPGMEQQGAMLPFDPGEVKIILQAMGGRLKAISRMQGGEKL